MPRHSKHGRRGGQPPGHSGALPLPRTPDEIRQHGLREFQHKRYVSAIAAWERIAEPDDRLKAALAEAHFRQVALSSAPGDVVHHLQRAVALRPGDSIYAYHLGLALHRQGLVPDALEQYKRATANGLASRTAGVTIAAASWAVALTLPIAWLESFLGARAGKTAPATQDIGTPPSGRENVDWLAAYTGWLRGLQFVRERLLETLGVEGVQPIRSIGQPFDPRWQVALDTAATGLDVPPGTVVSETRRGYAAGDRVLRYAEVIVARDLDARPAPPAAEL